MKRSLFETLLGMIVLVVAISFLNYGYNFVKGKEQQKTYTLKAYFNGAGGLNIGADVRMSGVSVGEVKGVSLDNENFKAVVTMHITSKIILPSDTLVEIASDGFIGGKYVRLSVVKSKGKPNNTNVLTNTKDVETLEQMLGKLIFLTTE